MLRIAEVVREGSWTQGWRNCILKQHNKLQTPRPHEVHGRQARRGHEEDRRGSLCPIL